MTRFQIIAIRLLLLAVFLAAWETLPRNGVINPILLPPLPSAPTAQRTFPLGDVLAVSAEIYRPSERTMLFLRKPGTVPSEFVVRVTEAAPPQRVVLDQPLPVLNDRHTTPYLSFAINTRNLGSGRFVLRLIRRSSERPADEVPGAVTFEVVAPSP